jgi:hypothetical protein
MAAGDITVTSKYLKIDFAVTADPTAATWSCQLDGSDEVVNQPLPAPFEYTIDPVTTGDHTLRVMQYNGLGVSVQDVSITVAVVDPAAILQQIRPSAQMVSDLVRTRIVSEGGGQVPPDDLDFNPPDNFTAYTYPTVTQVERLIDQATTYIVAQVPGSIAEDYLPSAKHLSALYTAILVEGSYFREQLTDDQVELYRNMLIAGIRGLGAAGSGESATSMRGGKVDSVMQRSVMTTSRWRCGSSTCATGWSPVAEQFLQTIGIRNAANTLFAIRNNLEDPEAAAPFVYNQLEEALRPQVRRLGRLPRRLGRCAIR